MSLGEMLLKLLLSLLAGGLVGLERERRALPAGLRTHMLVCAGSTLITLISMEISPNADPSRIAAQIVSGIGFLGAGTIFRAGNSVRGLTTAAGLWAVAGIGMGIAAGGSLLILGLVMSVAVFIVNRWVRLGERRFLRYYQNVTVRFQPGKDALSNILQDLEEREIPVRTVRWLTEKTAEGEGVVQLQLRLPAEEGDTSVRAWLSSHPGVLEVILE